MANYIKDYYTQAAHAADSCVSKTMEKADVVTGNAGTSIMPGLKSSVPTQATYSKGVRPVTNPQPITSVHQPVVAQNDQSHTPSAVTQTNAPQKQSLRDVLRGERPVQYDESGRELTNERLNNLGAHAKDVNIDKNGERVGSNEWRKSITGGKEEERQRKADRIALLSSALNDTILRIGNLAGAMNGAPSASFGTSSFDKTRAEIQSRKDKEASKKLAAEKLAYDRAKDADAISYRDKKFAYDVEKDSKENARKNAELQMKVDEHPYTIAAKAADAQKKVTDANVAKATAGYSEAKAKSDAEKAASAAANEKSRGGLISAQTSAANAQANKARIEAANAADRRYTHYASADDSKMWRVKSSDVKSLESHLKGIAKKKKWASSIIDINGNYKKDATSSDLLNAAFANSHEPEVQEILSKYGEEVDVKSPSAKHSLK